MADVQFSQELRQILDRIDMSRLKGKVAIKVHFGERGCKTYMDPSIVKAVYDKVSEKHEAALVECNVLYKGSRTIASEHIRLAKEHGFDFAPIDILDGEMGDDEIKVPVNDGLVDDAKLGKGLEYYDSMVVISHFKGHIAAGFGGALKNIGMGLGSRAGKLHMHSDVNPYITEDLCRGCGICAEKCNQDAITIVDGVATIDEARCNGCAMCIAVCPHGAVKVPWGGSTNEALQKKTIDYADAVMKTVGSENMVFINLLHDITEECDCVGQVQKPMMENIGFLLSNDPVAIDKASLDLAEKNSDGAFGRFNNVDNDVQVDYAAEKGIGEKSYKIIE
ncbi:MAG: DUF362 domain-containing protein [Candidatus Woesearchaeota archaeon]